MTRAKDAPRGRCSSASNRGWVVETYGEELRQEDATWLAMALKRALDARVPGEWTARVSVERRRDERG